MKFKRIGVCAVAAVVGTGLLATLAGCGGSDIVATVADPERTFNYWVVQSEGTGAGGLYDTYAQNPGVVYMTDKDQTYSPAVKSGDGYTKESSTVTNKIGLNFEAPMAGASPQQSFLTSLNSGTTDVLDLAYSPDTVVSLYEQGVLMDITWWVENYMPNYVKYLQDNDFYNVATSEVNGERKFLQLYYFTENKLEFQGYQYRRDWLLEYGTPFDTETGAFGTQTYLELHPDWGWQNYGTADAVWEDGIVFPSYYGFHYTSDGTEYGVGTLSYDQDLYDYIRGYYTELADGSEQKIEDYVGQWPVTLSDWEWMLDVFQTAIHDNGFTSGYGMTLYPNGFINTGNLVSSFGGGGIEWYRTPEGEDRDGDGKGNDVMFGADEGGFEEYIAVMRQWYQNGWIDGGFEANMGDLFWDLDGENVRQGYVGIYLAMDSQLMNQMDLSGGMEDDPTYGICSYGMPFPVNDKYGDASLQYKDPYCFYGATKEQGSFMVSTAAEKNGKDLAALFTFLDYCYSEEVGIIKAAGLSKEQMDASQEGVQKLYEEFGLVNGAWYYDENNEPTKTPEYDALDQNTQNMLKPNRIMSVQLYVKPHAETQSSLFTNQLWLLYSCTGYITESFLSQMTDAQYRLFQSSQTQMRNSFQSNIPGFILDGTGPLDREAFRAYISQLKSECTIDQITRALDALSHRLEEA